MKKSLLIFALLPLFFFGCDQEVSTSPPDPPPGTASFFVSSTPSHAAIYVNGRNSGKFTPDSIFALYGGTYEIKLRIPLYRDTLVIAPLQEGDRKQYFVDFLSNPKMLGEIKCETTPLGADIFLNDSATGLQTPYIIKGLKPGDYKVGFKLFSHWDEEKEIVVESFKQKYAYFEMVDTTIWASYTMARKGLPTNFLSAVAVDQNNVKWVGTIANGIFLFKDYIVEQYTETNSPLPSNSIQDLYYDDEGWMWIGTPGGAARVKDGVWEIFKTTTSGIPHDNVKVIKKDRNGDVWFGTFAGLARLSNGNWTVFNQENSAFPENWVTAVDFAPNGDIWIGTSHTGIIHRMAGVDSFYTSSKNDLPSDNITDINIEADGSVWIAFNPDMGHMSGVAEFNDSSFTVYWTIGLNNVIISSIYISPENEKWISTTGGIMRFVVPASRHFYYTGNSGLLSDNIRDAVIDQDGLVWIATATGGLTKVRAWLLP